MTGHRQGWGVSRSGRRQIVEIYGHFLTVEIDLEDAVDGFADGPELVECRPK